jgi:hypothetical protein
MIKASLCTPDVFFDKKISLFRKFVVLLIFYIQFEQLILPYNGYGNGIK